MILISEASDQIEKSASSRDLENFTRTAELIGFKVYYIPQDFSVCENAENAVAHIPLQEKETVSFWIGYIPDFQRYEDIYKALLEKNIRLVNSPEEHILIQQFDNFYPLIAEFTAKSKIISSVKEVQNAVDEIGFSVFLKGTVQSVKSDGWKACVAENLEEAEKIAKRLFSLSARTRGKVIIREILLLRHSRKNALGFPIGREFRVFVFNQKVVGLGYYWEGDDKLKNLTKSEEEEVKDLAIETSKRLKVPYVSVDVGQLENREWRVIEVGDPQFSGVSQIPFLELWNNLKKIGN